MSPDQYTDSSAWGVSLTAAFSLDGHKINVGHGFLNLEINDLTPLTGRNYMLVKLNMYNVHAECN